MPKPIEFSASDPLVIRIHKDEGFWDIEPANNHKQHMNRRGRGTKPDASDSDMPNLNTEYRNRRAGNAPPLPHFKMDPHHTPIVMREGEFVKFVCEPAFAFSIWSDREPTVSAVAAAPGNPFGWTLPQSVTAGSSITAQVLMPAGGTGPFEQRFYKFTAFVVDQVTGQTVTVDPDGYCDR